MFTRNRFDGSPADTAVLHDAQRGSRIAAQEPHPGIDDEDMKAVVCQHLRGGGDRVQQTGDLALERRPQPGKQLFRIDLVQ